MSIIADIITLEWNRNLCMASKKTSAFVPVRKVGKGGGGDFIYRVAGKCSEKVLREYLSGIIHGLPGLTQSDDLLQFDPVWVLSATDQLVLRCMTAAVYIRWW